MDTLNQNQLNQQWFWYSVNGAPQQTIDQISAATVYNFSTPSTPIDDIGVVYQNSQLTVQVQYVLSGDGSGSGKADMQEYLSIVNNGASSISLSFYQYSNFNLFQDNQNSVTISGSPGAYGGAVQTTMSGGGNGIAEVIDAPLANYAEAGFAPTTLAELNSGSYYTLNDSTSAVNGDVTWAFQWNAVLAPNGQSGDMLDITKDKGLSISIVPEPSTLGLIVLGVGALGLMLRRRAA
ncbi:MAG TPA: PEP-CTERM sorting domain-containing protein [Candidatus Sulfopaludibacter sp.]|nr:PEP-CTERM sorting domain-containing protein [Candidatus Sulfopaludibacter sp.]